jgi:uncharacterized protein (DUF362 family)
MDEHKAGTSRRDFLRKCVAGAVALSAAGELKLLPAQVAAVQSRVVVARDAKLRAAGSKVDSGRVFGLLDRGMQAFYGVDNPLQAWRKLARPGERVGLKVNTIAGRGLSTNVQLVDAICERLQQAGIPARDILVWDRESRELERAGFRLSSDANRARCLGTDAFGYEEQPQSFGTVRSKLSKILTRNCDVLINVPVLKDHSDSGITAALKNMYGVIDNPYSLHAGGCNPGIADLNMLPAIRTKMRLTICDATTASFDGGPSFEPESTWQHNGIILARDPVALDFIAWRIIEHKRAEQGLKTLPASGRAPRFIALAADARHQLGTNDPKRISLVEV